MTRGSGGTSSGVPSAIFSPWSSTVTWSDTPMTTFMSCSMSRIGQPALGAQRLHQAAQLIGLLRVHAGRRLVEQEQLRVGGQRAGDLQPPLVAVGQVHRQLARALEADEAESSIAFSRASLLLAALERRVQDHPGEPRRSRECMPTSTFSTAVIVRNSLMFWNVRAMPARVIEVGPLGR